MENSSAIKPSPLQAAAGSRVQAAPLEPECGVDGSDVRQQPARLQGLLSRVFRSVSTWGFVDQGIVSVASFAVAVVVGRTCGSEQLGVYSLAVSLFWLVAGIPNALVWTPYTSRAPSLSRDARQQYAGSALLHVFAVSSLIAVGFIVVGLVPWPNLSTTDWFWPMCQVLAPFTVLMMLREHLRRMLLAHMNTPALLLVDVPIAVIQLSVIGILASLGRLTFTSALFATALSCLWCLGWLVRQRKEFQFNRLQLTRDWNTSFQFGRWLLLVSIAWLLGDASFRWLVGSLHGLNELGQFSAAFTTVMFLNPIMLTVQNLARSIFANGLAQSGEKELRRLAFKGTWHFAWVFGLLFICLAACGGMLVQLFFSSEFEGLGWVVGSLCIGLYLHVLNFPVDAALSALRGGQAMLAAALVRLALILAAGVPLIAIYGSIGVGIALAIGSLGAGMLQWNLFLRRCQHAH